MLEKDDIIDIRATLRMTLDEFAEACGVSPSTISSWESARRFPSRRHMIRLNELKSRADRMKAFMASESA